MESRIALLTFTYRFGSGQNDAPKKGRGAGEENGPTGGGGGEM